eukprot:gb/GFBE01066361.1/.p1 GENE.gb/GFBE01066361.1/~~gb/GFBE01066361.1/.p1  ORF type:complete len:461 (+),score=93.76 gb/GFBE01066361.1/:1-1383(+)
MASQSKRLTAKVEEDLMQNPFLQVLRASFEGIYRQAAERGERTALLVPCAECLEGESFGQVFAETHLLQATCVPGCYMNLLGQGVEIKDTSVSTHLGFQEHRVCEVLQSESMYDLGNTFKVLVVDKPLIGRHKTLPSATDRAPAAKASASSATAEPTADDWLNTTPSIQGDFFDQVDRFRKTFVQVLGCEHSTAERIREIADETAQRLSRHHKLTLPTQLRQLDFTVSRQAYAALHSFVFPHLVRILETQEVRLQQAIRSYESVAELLQAIPGADGRGLGLVDVRECSKELELMDRKITPHEKIACIDKAHSLLQQCVAEGAKSGQSGGGPVEITGDDVLSLFILAVHGSQVKHNLAHIAHVEMYLQGAAGRSGSSEAARFEEAGYAVSALQAGLQFFLEERRINPGPSSRAPPRPSTNVFSSYLPQGAQTAGGNLDADSDKAAMHLQGLVRQARSQGVR